MRISAVFRFFSRGAMPVGFPPSGYCGFTVSFTASSAVDEGALILLLIAAAYTERERSPRRLSCRFLFALHCNASGQKFRWMMAVVVGWPEVKDRLKEAMCFVHVKVTWAEDGNTKQAVAEVSSQRDLENIVHFLGNSTPLDALICRITELQEKEKTRALRFIRRVTLAC